jgi:predicted protein tyrosine phosphatase
MNILFVCSQNRLRSPTAEAVFADYPGVEASSAGTNTDADNPVSLDQIEWADIIFVMEDTHRRRLKEMFSKVLKTKKVVVLGIPDRYSYMNPELVQLLKLRVCPHLRN